MTRYPPDASQGGVVCFSVARRGGKAANGISKGLNIFRVTRSIPDLLCGCVPLCDKIANVLIGFVSIISTFFG